MYLLLHAEVCDNHNAVVNGCAIELTKKKVKGWIEKINLAEKLAKQESNFRGLEYIEYASWIGKKVDCDEGHVDNIVLNENVLECADENTIVCTEVERVHVYDNRILFSAYFNETTTLLESQDIWKKELKGIYTALSCRQKRLPFLIDSKSSIVRSIVKLRLKGAI